MRSDLLEFHTSPDEKLSWCQSTGKRRYAFACSFTGYTEIQ